MRHHSSAQLPAHTEGWEGSVGSPGYPLTPPDPPGGTGRGSTRADTHLSAQHVGSAPRGAQFPPRAPSAVAPGSPGHRGAWLRHPTLPRGFVPCCRGVQQGGAEGECSRGVQQGGAAGGCSGGGAHSAARSEPPRCGDPHSHPSGGHGGATGVPTLPGTARGGPPTRGPPSPAARAGVGAGGHSVGADCGAPLHAWPRGCPGSAGSTDSV